jgi:hypothetical protein
MEKIKIKNKYVLFKFNKEKDKVKKITESKSIDDLKENVIGKKIGENYEIILLKLSKEPKFNEKNINSPLGKLIGGPIKITFKIYSINENKKKGTHLWKRAGENVCYYKNKLSKKVRESAPDYEYDEQNIACYEFEDEES